MAFDRILSVNFPQVYSAPLDRLAEIYGSTLQRQVPVGRMHGRVNKRLVRQFRLPGFPLVMVTTDVLQEGEDLHTFCRRVLHYGITWTPSAVEQRTGRVDRIGSLAQRRLDGNERPAVPEDLIQVFYPYLRDTVEVLQVRRVLQRLNRFLKLIHKKQRGQETATSRVDMNREDLSDLSIPFPLAGLLESAFPVAEGWRHGVVGPVDLPRVDLRPYEEHLDALWSAFIERRPVREERSGVRRRKVGAYMLEGLSPTAFLDSDTSDSEQQFHLELRSQAAGDATLVRCVSNVDQRDLTGDAALSDRVYRLQKGLGRAKVCLRRDEGKRRDTISIEGDLYFDPATTQLEELELLIRRTVTVAGCFRTALKSENPSHWEEDRQEVLSDEDPRTAELLARIKTAASAGRHPWTVRDDRVIVSLAEGSRQQEVYLGVRRNMYVFSSIVLGRKRVTENQNIWWQISDRAWRRNALKELVTFAFDEKDNLIGLIEQPVATLDHQELEFYIDTLAKECDRFEFALTGEDLQ